MGELSRRLVKLPDEKRRHMARELHDSIGQNLVALVTNLTLLQKSASSLGASARRALSQCLALSEDCFREIRTISHLLHPPLLDELGLDPALRWYADGFSQRSGISVSLDLPSGFGRLPAEVEMTIFRIVQEGLSNIYRHAGSRTAKIRVVREPSHVVLEISDEGRGIPREVLEGHTGVGIAGMRERARQLGGSLEIDSSGNGVTLKAVLPLALVNA